MKEDLGPEFFGGCPGKVIIDNLKVGVLRHPSGKKARFRRSSRVRPGGLQCRAGNEALHKEPFEPFTIRLADGRGLGVPDPDFVAVAARRVIVVAKDNYWAVVEPLLIVSLDHNGPRSSSTS